MDVGVAVGAVERLKFVDEVEVEGEGVVVAVGAQRSVGRTVDTLQESVDALQEVMGALHVDEAEVDGPNVDIWDMLVP